MTIPDHGPTTEYQVVVNDEEQYSIWPAERNTPRGWYEVGLTRTTDACLAHIRTVWTDLRPRGLRERTG
jgi:MbtH protein